MGFLLDNIYLMASLHDPLSHLFSLFPLLNLDGFQKSLLPCALGDSNLRIIRVNALLCICVVFPFVLSLSPAAISCGVDKQWGLMV